MSETAEKILQALYDEYNRTGTADYCNAAALSGLPGRQADLGVSQLESFGYIKRNVLGEAKLTKSGILYFM